MGSKKILKFISALAAISLLSSCVKDAFDFKKMQQQSWNPDLAIPLIYSSLSVENILNKDKTGSITVDGDNFCSIVYEGNLVSFKASELIILPPQNNNYTISLSAPQISALQGSGTITVNHSQTIVFNGGPNSPSIDSLIYKSGLLTDSVVSDFRLSGQLKISIPNAKKNSNSFSHTIPLNYAGSTPVVAKNSINLEGYHFDMTQNGTTTNSFDVEYELTLNYSGSNLPTTGDQLIVYQKNKNLFFDKIFGYIGQQSLIPPSQNTDTVALSLFKNSSSGASFSVVDPQIKMIIKNSFGVPIEANLTLFKGYTPPSSSLPITGTGVPSPLPIQSPNTTEIGQTKTTSFTLNNTNSNLATVFNSTPRNIVYQIQSLSNPLGPVSQNFLIDSSQIKIDMEVTIPLHGTASAFIIQDTIKEFNFDLGDDDFKITSLLLRTSATNGWPVDVAMQIYFTDSNYVKIDSLFAYNQVILPSGSVNGAGKVTSPSSKTTDVTFNEARINNLKNAARVIIKGVLNTSNSGSTNIKIYSSYSFDVKMGMQIKASVKF